NVLAKMPKLYELHLENDGFSTLPERIKSLQKLRYLYLNENEIEVLPASLQDMDSLEYIDLNKNPIPNIFWDSYRLSPTIKVNIGN
ncbi:MAG: leucine-rich repeat domain-containing protein, partial [Bacteroidota bacterium]